MHYVGITAYTAVVWLVTIKCALETSTWTKWNHITTWGSFATWYIFLIVYGEMWSYLLEMGENWHHMYRFLFPNFMNHWAVVFLAVSIGATRDVVWKFWKRTFRPQLQHRVQRWEAYVREGRHGLTDFNYAMMKRVHPELIPRQRVQDAPRKAPPPAPDDMDGDPLDGHMTDGSAEAHSGFVSMQGDQSQRGSWDGGADQNYQQPLISSGFGDPGPQRVRRQAPGHPGYASQYGHMGPPISGYAFSQAEGQQVELMAARSGADAPWAHGLRQPSPRAQVHPPGRMPISGMVENHDGGMGSMHGMRSAHTGRAPPRNPHGPPQHRPHPSGPGSTPQQYGVRPLSPGSYHLRPGPGGYESPPQQMRQGPLQPSRDPGWT